MRESRTTGLRRVSRKSRGMQCNAEEGRVDHTASRFLMSLHFPPLKPSPFPILSLEGETLSTLTDPATGMRREDFERVAEAREGNLIRQRGMCGSRKWIGMLVRSRKRRICPVMCIPFSIPALIRDAREGGSAAKVFRAHS